MSQWILLVVSATLLIGFQNCSKDSESQESGGSSAAGSPSPSPGPASPNPTPGPGGGGQVQPTSTNAMSDVKPRTGGSCPGGGYGLYDLVNTTSAVATAGWEHFTCVKPYSTGDASVIGDAQLIIGAGPCPSGFEMVQTVQPSTTNQPGWNLAHSICIQRAAVPVSASFVTYFYYSAPGQGCRSGDSALGSATFCAGGNAGSCMNGQLVSFCRALQ